MMKEIECTDRDERAVHPDVLRLLDAALKTELGHGDGWSDVATAAQMLDRAEPGAWRVLGGRVVRYDGTEVASPASLDLMAAARRLMPSLIRTVCALRRVLVSQIVLQVSARAESRRDKEALLRHRDEIANAAGAAGPADEFELILYLYRTQIFYDIARTMNRSDRVLPLAPEFTGRPSVEFLKRWMAGHSVRAEIAGAVDEGAKFQREWLFEAEQKQTKHAEAVEEFRRLLDELRAGRIPAELSTNANKRRDRTAQKG